MINQNGVIWFTAAVMALLAPSLARAQSIYKCPSGHGRYEYTDTPCTGAGATVIHKATAWELAAKQNADDQQAMVSMLRSGQVDAAKHYAVAHHQESLYNSILASLVQEGAVAEQRRQQQAELVRQQRAQAVADKIDDLSAQNEALQQQVGAQAKELRLQRRSAQAAQDAEINAQNAEQNAAMRAQQEAETPKFNPQSRQWCQQIGGTVQCH